MPIYDQTVTYFVDQPMQAISNSLISVDPLKDVIENENTIDSSAEIMRQFKENKWKEYAKITNL